MDSESLLTQADLDFIKAKEILMEIAVNAYEEGRNHKERRNARGYGQNLQFNQTKTYRIIIGLRSVSEQITELLMKGQV